MIKNTGIIRKVDELGRFVIPAELRNKYKYLEGTFVQIWLDENEDIIIKKLEEIPENEKECIGIIRKIDELGRIVIPIEMRELLGIEEKDPLETWINDKQELVMRKHHIKCVICRSKDDLIDIKEKKICKKCLKIAGSNMKSN